MLILVVCSGCEGFFVAPALTSITVGPPTPSVLENNTLQMSATGTLDDGTTETLTSKATWSTSDPTIATISNTGVLQGVATGTATITASSSTVSGSTTVTVVVSGVASIQVSPTNASISSGQTQQFKATAVLQDGEQRDVTNAVTWKSSNPAVATIDATGLATALSVSGSTATSTQITATSGSITSNAAVLNVTP
jgi:uncharacterized protein YjdB